MRISFVPPEDNGETIDSYTILILASDGSLSEDTTNCDGTTSTIKTQEYCDIPMTTLRSDPYNL